MKIAILGWGSLCWQPKNENGKKLETEGEWHNDGPSIPIEFARISKNGRLTLVIYPKAKKIPVLWIMSPFPNLKNAAKNLQEREGCPTEKRIHYISNSDIEHIPTSNNGFVSSIKFWASTKGLDGVVWTGLTENFEDVDKANMEFNKENVIKYLKSLKGTTKEKAKEYIIKAPKQVQTEMREHIQKELGWR
jgi:hypothetical protein